MHSKSVLVIDDHPGVRDMLGHALASSGIPAQLAKNGDEGVRLFEQHRHEIGCVLLDVRMPGRLDGPDTFGMLRSLSPSVPIVFMTGEAGPYAIEDLQEMGPAAVLAKPLLVREVVALLRTYVA